MIERATTHLVPRGKNDTYWRIANDLSALAIVIRRVIEVSQNLSVSGSVAAIMPISSRVPMHWLP
jgi:hypothetical protein